MLVRDVTYSDGVISINKNTDWDFNIGENISASKNNLAFGVLRAMARIFGFGSSIKVKDNNQCVFGQKKAYIIFDTLISNSAGQKLNSIRLNGGRPSEELTSYINNENDKFWIETSNAKYPIQSTPYSQASPPFSFVTDSRSLMTADLHSGNYILGIDGITKDVLEYIGWGLFSEDDVWISSTDVPSTGIASAYSNHHFTVNSNVTDFTNPRWELSAEMSDGSVSTIELPDEGMACTVNAIDNESAYKIRLDGDIRMSLTFKYDLNGIAMRTRPFNLYLELKPIIESAELISIVPNNLPESYNAHFKVKYRGADRVTVEVEQEYSSNVSRTYLKEPYIAYGIADYIYAYGYAWIDLTVKNEYGKDSYTITLAPLEEMPSGIDVTGIIRDKNNHFEVFDLTGSHIGSFRNLDTLKARLTNGIYIVNEFSNGIRKRIFKYLKR